MATKSKIITDTVRCDRDGEAWGEYVRAGDTYLVERREDGKGDAHFRNARTGSGTFMRSRIYRNALASGNLLLLAQSY